MSDPYYFHGPNRTLCQVLEEMRQCFKNLNFAAIPGLIEEAQTYGNRMEAALHTQKDLARMEEAKSKLKVELKALQVELNAAKAGL